MSTPFPFPNPFGGQENADDDEDEQTSNPDEPTAGQGDVPEELRDELYLPDEDQPDPEPIDTDDLPDGEIPDPPETDPTTAQDIGNVTSAGIEAAFDNDAFSVQDSLRGAARFLTPQSESDEEFARAFQEGSIQLREGIGETIKNVDVPGEDEPVRVGGENGVVLNTPAATDTIGSGAGGLFDVFVTDPTTAGSQLFLGVEPLPGQETGIGFGGSEQADDPTGNTDSSPNPLELIDLVPGAFAAGAAGKAGVGTVKGAATGSAGMSATDEIARVLGKSDIFTESGGLTDEGASALDDIGPVADEPGSAIDESLEAADYSPGADTSALRRTDTAVEETGTLPDSFETLDDINAPRTVAEAEEGLGDLAGRADDTVDDLLGATDETPRTSFTEGTSGTLSISDEVSQQIARFTDDADETITAGRAADEGGQAVDDTFASGFDEGAGAADDVSGAADDFASTADEGAAAADDAAEESGGILSSIRGQITPLRAAAGGGLLGAGALALTSGKGIENPNAAGGAASNGAWSWSVVDELREGDVIGLLIDIRLENESRGFAVQVKDSPDKVLNENADPVSAAVDIDNPETAQGQDAPHPEPRFGSSTAARNAFRTYASGSDSSTTSATFNGSLDIPGETVAGQGFATVARVRNTASTDASAQFTLVARRSDAEDRAARLGRMRDDLPANSARSLEFNTQSAIRQLPPGEYVIQLYATNARGGEPGKIADSNFSVIPRDEADQGAWGTVERLAELGAGWFLFGQQKRDGSDTRFQVAGKRSDGTTIYLNASGRGQESIHHFDTREEAVAAFQRWGERQQAGETSPAETPDPSASSPRPSEVKADADSGGSGLVGALGGETGFAVVVTLVVFGGGLWYVSDGEPIAYLEKLANDAEAEVKQLLG